MLNLESTYKRRRAALCLFLLCYLLLFSLPSLVRTSLPHIVPFLHSCPTCIYLSLDSVHGRKHAICPPESNLLPWSSIWPTTDTNAIWQSQFVETASQIVLTGQQGEDFCLSSMVMSLYQWWYCSLWDKRKKELIKVPEQKHLVVRPDLTVLTSSYSHVLAVLETA